MADLAGWKVLVTAGGTREPIDPVRYIGNRSSGRMGNAIALEAAARGAKVTLVTTVSPPDLEGDIISVETAAEMAEAVWERAPGQDAIVMAAAVADFRPVRVHEHKLARADGPPVIELEPAPDILAGVVAADVSGLVVGFAAEAGSLERAITKARSKGVDVLVANDVLAPGSGFGTTTNEVTVILADGTVEPWPLLSKAEVASRLWDLLAGMRAGRG